MPHLTQERAIKEYWEKVKDQYPDIDFTTFTKICKHPFEYIKKSIRKDHLPIILIKYLGKFRPFAPMIQRQLNFLIKKEDEKNIEKSKYLQYYIEALKEYDDSKRTEENFSREIILDD